MNHSRWNVLPAAPAQYLEASNYSPLVAQLLYNRGLVEPSSLETFIAVDERLLEDPYLLPDVHQAIARIYRALLSGEKIAVYGDYDVDGVTGTAILVNGLSALGAQTVPYIPHRVNEGHGLRLAALEGLSQQGVSLVVTVDCGITDLAEIKRAKRMGMDVVVTDHHVPLDAVPPAEAVVDPKLPHSEYPFTELAGVGVAYKFLKALFQSLGKKNLLDGLFDLVALGTVADMSPLVGENRYLVKRGLDLMNSSPRLGIREMITRAGMEVGKLDADGIAWILAPRLNAVGRLEHAIVSYQLLMTESAEEAQKLTGWLEEKNAERQQLTADALDKAREQIQARGLLPLLFVSDGDYPIGVAGPVAGRLSEEFYRPAVVVKTGERTSFGSCRSIPEFNIINALNQCRQFLTRFGGHAQAAGFTLPTRNLSCLCDCLIEMATTQLAGVDLRPRIDIDAEVRLPSLGGDTFKVIQKLAPFGRGNPAPTFLSRGVEVLDCRTMGNNGAHLRLKLKQGGTVWDGVSFSSSNCLTEVSPRLNIVYNLEVDRWCGNERLRLNILDFAPAGQ